MRAASALLIAIAGALLLPNVAQAAGDPYSKGDHGYDISWPQCGEPVPAGSFAVIGVNGGAPFSANLCMIDQYAVAPGTTPPSLYINTGYQDSYRRFITPACWSASRAIPGTDAGRDAWAMGCSEAETSVRYAYAVGVSNIAMWWLDVEVLNQWSSNLGLNRMTIQGAVTRLWQTYLPVGIYSSRPQWHAITGTLAAPSHVSAEWSAVGSCSASFTPLTRVPVWLAQHMYDNLDHDVAC